MKRIVLIAHNIRSTHNVGSMLRTADGLGVEHVYLTGYTPYPFTDIDSRLPHLARKIDKQIQKVALGAEQSVRWSYSENIKPVIDKLRRNNFKIAALEQSPQSSSLKSFSPPNKVALLVGDEVSGLPEELLALCDEIVEIPMVGKKESFNVSVAAAIGLSHLVL